MANNYKKSWNYLKNSRNYLLVILIVFLISILIGFFYPVFFVEIIKKFIEELIEKTAGMNFFQLLFYILQNNLISAFIGMFLGIVFGIFPLLLAAFNGYVLGFVSSKTADVAGLGILLRLLPHGIFEIPAIVLSLGLGLKLARFIFSEKRKETLKSDLENSLRVFVYVIIPLLIIAGIIEAGLIFLLG